MKTVLITGATSGIGKATASVLSARDFEIVFIARDKSKAGRIKNEIINASGNKNVSFILADLTSKKQIRESVEIF
jgi:retinol dehydrogenase-12